MLCAAGGAGGNAPSIAGHKVVHQLNTEAPDATSQIASGSLRLEFERSEGSSRTELALRVERPPLRVVRAFETPDGAALVHLHNLSGGVLGGDRLELDVMVHSGARAQVTTTGATRVYRRGVSAGTAEQLTMMRVEEDGLLEYLPDPLIPYRDSSYRQRTIVDLDPGAGLFWWETLAPGREAHGEMFAYDRLSLEVEIRSAGIPIIRERASLEPRVRPLTSPARFGTYCYWSSFYACRSGTPGADWLSLERELGEACLGLSEANEAVWGASALPRDGLVVRGLTRSGRSIPATLLEIWRLAKRRLYGAEAIPPRKVY